MILQVIFPLEPFNGYVKNGSIENKMKSVMDELKPEAAYFFAENGKRSAVLIVDLADPSRVPSLAEPLFLVFNAEVSIQPVMLPEDLGKSNLGGLGKKWS